MAILPVRATRRSYLNVVLLVGIMLLELGFIIPLARQPQQCYNAITPNDMYSSTTCAFSGVRSLRPPSFPPRNPPNISTSPPLTTLPRPSPPSAA